MVNRYGLRDQRWRLCSDSSTVGLLGGQDHVAEAGLVLRQHIHCDRILPDRTHVVSSNGSVSVLTASTQVTGS